MNEHDEKQMKTLLRQSLPPVKGEAGPGRDLWPEMLRRLDTETAARTIPGWTWLNSSWFDGALLAGLVGLGVLFPASIPVFLYYL
ncbi:MAG: hypothetical protein ACLPXT_13085 [Terracidiphilus sp.]